LKIIENYEGAGSNLGCRKQLPLMDGARMQRRFAFDGWC